MRKFLSMLLNAKDLDNINVEVKFYKKPYEPGEDTVAIINLDRECYIQLRADALRGFIEKLEAAEAEINGTAVVKSQDEMIEEALQRHGHVTGGSHE